MNKSKRSQLTSFFLLLTVLLTACQPAPASTPDMGVAYTQAFETALAQLQPTATLLPNATETSVSVPTVITDRTPPALPSTFVATQLNKLDTPHTYIDDTCQYLHNKWNSSNATPGTIVMVVMLHGIIREKATKIHDISVPDFKRMMKDLKDQGFEAINATQFADFMDHNAKIPARSVLLIQDDRHFAENFNEHFRPYWEKWGWPVVNAYIAKDERPDLWAENAALAAEGWVDYQAHGVIHNENMTDASTDEFLTGELQGAITNLQKYYNKTPVAIIWPGGNFGVRPVQFARQYGYRVGFTVNPRGPIMYNWVPLADQADPARPAYLAEGHINDPRMVLPRYWPAQVSTDLDTVRNIGNEAAAYAEQNKAAELEYYDIMCAPALGQLP